MGTRNKIKTKFKETEIGEIPEGWNLYVFSQAIDVNPRRELKKGAIAKKVSMQGLQEFRRKIASYERAKYNGGTKFQNNDTLMARITPCLENGKTAFVDILDNNEIGFGSTEFNVLCGEEGKTRFRSLPENVNLDDILCLIERRCLKKDNTFSYNGTTYNLTRNRRSITRKAKVELHIHPKKKIRAFYKDEFVQEFPCIKK